MSLTQRVFAGYGAFLIALMCVCPVWDAIGMLLNRNYVFWMGPILPLVIVTLWGFCVLVFLMGTDFIFATSPFRDPRLQALMFVPSVSFVALGLITILVSVPMSTEVNQVRDDLMFRCGQTPETELLQEHYVSLLELRKQPECMKEASVESCSGYKAGEPRSEYLKFLEKTFHCSGFCVSWELQSYDAGAGQGQGSASDPTEIAQGTKESGDVINVTTWSRRTGVHLHPESTGYDEAGSHVTVHWKRPPALFVTRDMPVTCDGAAARDLIFAGSNRADALWASGTLLFIVALVMALWDWTPLRSRRKYF